MRMAVQCWAPEPEGDFSNQQQAADRLLGARPYHQLLVSLQSRRRGIDTATDEPSLAGYFCAR